MLKFYPLQQLIMPVGLVNGNMKQIIWLIMICDQLALLLSLIAKESKPTHSFCSQVTTGHRGVPVPGGNAKAAAAHGETNQGSQADVPPWNFLSSISSNPAGASFFALGVAVSFIFPFFFFFHAWLNLSHLVDPFWGLFPPWHSVKASHSARIYL